MTGFSVCLFRRLLVAHVHFHVHVFHVVTGCWRIFLGHIHCTHIHVFHVMARMRICFGFWHFHTWHLRHFGIHEVHFHAAHVHVTHVHTAHVHTAHVHTHTAHHA